MPQRGRKKKKAWIFAGVGRWWSPVSGFDLLIRMS
jgi:hypothetical protein